jgi:regulator of sirC expression with transglutaminase-like and TPR domain
MSNNKEFDALISLIDDPDDTVRGQVVGKILQLGEAILPQLKDNLEKANIESPEGLEKLAEIVAEIEFANLSEKILDWSQNPQDLLQGMWLTNLTGGAEVDLYDINKEIERIKLEVWLDLRHDLTALEKVNVLNHVFFKRFGFKGNNLNYHAPENSFLHKVVKNRQGNPISLAVLYALVAQRLYIPVYGVNLPQHFVLAYLDVPDLPSPGADSKGLIEEAPLNKEVLFYINPFNEGAVFGKKHIDEFLKQLNLEPVSNYYYPCSNKDVIKRVLRNLYNAYALKNQTEKVARYNSLIQKLS